MSGDSPLPSEMMPIGSRLRLNSSTLGESTSSDATALLGVAPVPSQTLATRQPTRVFTRSDEKRREELLARKCLIYQDDCSARDRRTRCSGEEKKGNATLHEREGDTVCEPEKAIQRSRDQTPNLYSPPLFFSPPSQDEGAPSHMDMPTRHSIVRVSSSSSNVSPPPLSSSSATHVRATRQEGATTKTPQTATTMTTTTVGAGDGYNLHSRRSSGVGLTEPSAPQHVSHRATFSESEEGQRTCRYRSLLGVPSVGTVHLSSSQEERREEGGCGRCVEDASTMMAAVAIPYLTAEEEEELVELEERYKVFIAEGLRRMHLLAQTMGGNATEQKRVGVGVGLGRAWERFVGVARSAFGARSLRGFAKLQQSQPSSDACTDGDDRAQRQPLVSQNKQNAPASGSRKAAAFSDQTLGTTRKDSVLLAIEKILTLAILGASIVACLLCLWSMLTIANSAHAGGALLRLHCGVGRGQHNSDGHRFNSTTETRTEASCVVTGGNLSHDTISSFSWVHALFSAITFAGTFFSRRAAAGHASATLTNTNNRGSTRSLDKNSPPPTTIISTPVARPLVSRVLSSSILSSSVIPNVRTPDRPMLYFWLRQCFFLGVFLCGFFFCTLLGFLQHQYGACGGGQPSAALLSLHVAETGGGSEVPFSKTFQSVFGWYMFLNVCDVDSLFASPSYRMAGLGLLSTDVVLTGATFIILCIGLYSALLQCLFHRCR